MANTKRHWTAVVGGVLGTIFVVGICALFLISVAGLLRDAWEIKNLEADVMRRRQENLQLERDIIELQKRRSAQLDEEIALYKKYGQAIPTKE